MAHDAEVKARASAMITLKQVMVSCPPGLREALSVLNDKVFKNAAPAFGSPHSLTKPFRPSTPPDAATCVALHPEIADDAAEMLVIFGDQS